MQTKPKDAPLILDKPMDAALTIPQSWTEYRDESVANAKTLTEVKYPDNQALTSAVHHLKTLKEIISIIEKAEEALRKPINARLKEYRADRDNFLAEVSREHLRITGLTNHYQRKADEEREQREREARQAQLRAEQEARAAREAEEKAQRDLEAAKTAKAREAAEDALLEAQLKQESATASAEQASAQLAIPRDTPKGFVTKVRFDFEITDPRKFIAEHGDKFTWKKEDESFKMERASFLKLLNGDDEASHSWHPPEGQQSHTFADLGIRIFRDVSTHTR